ncbi:aldo/keto reductase [Streptomyces sp. 4N509B]|uniref:aldo/keto reductase n=1 Tax=Streptomyces sp. 4N509B TaxID=3457413 RepID=UPI003FD1E394
MFDDEPATAHGVTRRRVLRAGGGLAAAAAATAATDGRATAAPTPAAPPAPERGDLIRRQVPKTGEWLPAIGLGTFMTFDTRQGADTAHVTEVVRRFWEEGGRLIDTSPLYGTSEANTGTAVAGLGIQNQVFLTNKIWSTGDYLWDDSHALASLERSLERLARDRPVDVLQCHNLVNVDCVIPLLHAWKQEGLVRHIGLTHHEPAYYDIMADWVERAELDFIQVHYSIRTREAEARLLPAAADNGVAVMVNMPLEKGRLHHVVADRALPGLAAELGVHTWSQYFLKWVLSHPAVTCALPATSDPGHLLENVAAMRGPLPDAHTRRRMVRQLTDLPGFDDIPTTPWYPGTSYPGLVSDAAARLRQRSPWWPPTPPT